MDPQYSGILGLRAPTSRERFKMGILAKTRASALVKSTSRALTLPAWAYLGRDVKEAAPVLSFELRRGPAQHPHIRAPGELTLDSGA